MTSPSVSAPLHWRHDLAGVREAIKHRYQTFELKLGPQVVTLQQAPSFRLQCVILYERGYKDWMILGAVFNLLLQSELARNGIGICNLRSQQAAEKAIEIAQSRYSMEVDEDTDRFCGDEFMRALHHFNFTALATYGFELGRQALDARIVEKFLRDRLGYFEMDLPHVPLFGKEVGTWPDLSSD